MGWERSTYRKWLLTALKLLIVVAVLWALRQTLYEAWSQFGAYQWRIQPGWMLLSGILYLLALLLAGLYRHPVLRVLRPPT